MECTIKRTDLVLEEAKLIAGQKAGGQVRSPKSYFSIQQGEWLTLNGLTQKPVKDSVQIKSTIVLIMFFQRQNKTKGY